MVNLQRIAFLFLLAFMVWLPCRAQSIDELRGRIRAAEIRNSGDYKWGEGSGATQEAAKEAASNDLVTRIRTMVFSDATHTVEETDTAFSSTYRKSSRLLSIMQLQGLDYLELPAEEEKYHFLAFITTESLNESLSRQRQRIRDMVNEARTAEAETRLDDALRLNYWAYLLTNTVDTLNLSLPNQLVTDPGQALLEHIWRIIDDIEVTAQPCTREDEFIGAPLRVTYKGKPVKSLDFSYYTGDGMDRGPILNGNGYMELVPSAIARSKQKQNIQFEYADVGRMLNAPDIQALYEVFRNKELNTWKKVELTFPFIPEEQGETTKSTTSPPEPQVSESVAQTRQRTSWPVPILVLAAQEATNNFMEAINSYVKNNRLAVHQNRPVPGDMASTNLYIAVVNNENVLGVFHVEKNQYVDVRREKRLNSLKRKEYEGARLIWIEVNESW